jgi:succinyl-CoA synthetase beta subunit
MSASKRSRVPDGINVTDAHYQFLDAIDKRQQSVANLTDLDTGATTAQIVAALNQILAAHRTK